MKLIIVGRRAPGTTRAAMKRHMLDVHGPLVLADPELRATTFARYRQNHVVDGRYGAEATIGRDMVAEMELHPDVDPVALEAHPHMLTRVRPDEVNFAHLADRVFTPVREDVVRTPPAPAGPGEPARHLKVIHFLRAADGSWGEPFRDAWAAVDGMAVAAADPLGYVRNVTLPGPHGVPAFAAVLELWFAPGDEDAVDRWVDAATATGLLDVDRSYALTVTEHQLHPPTD